MKLTQFPVMTKIVCMFFRTCLSNASLTGSRINSISKQNGCTSEAICELKGRNCVTRFEYFNENFKNNLGCLLLHQFVYGMHRKTWFTHESCIATVLILAVFHVGNRYWAPKSQRPKK